MVSVQLLNDSGEFVGNIDLYKGSDFNLKYSKKISDLKNINSRSTHFSSDFDVPNTANNERLLFGIRDINASATSLNVLGLNRCVILFEGNQVERGFISAKKSQVKGDFTLFFRGGNFDWIEIIGDKNLNEMLWRDYETGLYSIDAKELFTIDRINTLTGIGYDLTYPYVDRNNGLAFLDFRPMINFYNFFKSIEVLTGYTFDSDWLESLFIKGGGAIGDMDHEGLGFDPNISFTVDESDIRASIAKYGLTEITTPLSDLSQSIGNIGVSPSVPTYRMFYRFNTKFTVLVSDDNVLFDVASSTYAVGVSGLYSINFKAFYTALYFDYTNGDQLMPLLDNPLYFVPPNIRWYIVAENTFNTSINGNILASGVSSVVTNSESANFTLASLYETEMIESIGDITLFEGQNISVFAELLEDAQTTIVDLQDLQTNSKKYWRLNFENQSFIEFKLKSQIQLGDEFRINSLMPKEIKIIDVIKDFKTVFNLYFDVDLNRKKIICEPRDEFFEALTSAVDITDKIDNSSPIDVNFESNFKSKIKFKYKVDSSDKWLERWEKFSKRTYAQYIHSLSPSKRFEGGEEVIQLGVLTPAIQRVNSVVTSIVRTEWDNDLNAKLPVNNRYAPKLYQLVRGIHKDRFGNKRIGDRILSVAVMEGFDGLDTYQNRKLTFNGEGGLVQTYYGKTLANINDFVQVDLTLKISNYEFFSWNMRKPLYISYPENIKGYYIVTSINNHDVNGVGLTRFTLLKYKSYTSVPLDTTQVTNVDPDIITEVEEGGEAVMVEEGGLIVNCLDDNFQFIYK
jgi:hypothetical protein